MEKKIVITKDNYREIMYKRAIILCWFLLGLSFVIKICGGNFFNIVCNNKNFVKVCNFLNNNFGYYIVTFIFYYISTFIFYYTTGYSKRINKKIVLIITLSIIISFVSRYISLRLGQIFDYLLFFITCFILCKYAQYSLKESILRILSGFLLNNIFQLISMFVKNLGIFEILVSNLLIQIIFCIDYYIMLILFMLYSIKINLRKEIY